MKQPVLRFYLDNKPNQKGERQILLDISIGYSEKDILKNTKKYKLVYISTYCKIKPENFGKYIQKGTKKVFRYDESIFYKYSKNNRFIRIRLEKIKNAVNEVTNDFYIKELNPTPKEFKEVLEFKLGRKKKEVVKEETVLEFLNKKIENHRDDILHKRKNALSENYLKTFVSLSRMFENYHLATGSEILFSDFKNKEFYWNFFKVVDAIYRGEIEVDNPNQKKKQRKDPTGYGVKSINKYAKLLQQVLSLGKTKGYTISLELNNDGLYLENPRAEKEIYLNEFEIQKAIDTPISESYIENTRQYLIMASLMGLRVEDMEQLHNLKPVIFNGRKRKFLGVKVDIGKTKTETIIPILKPIRDILKKNNDSFPVFKEGSVNPGMKKLCELLEIDSLEKRTKISFNQGKIITKDIPKYELISTHDCRRSFITNLLTNNVSGDRIKYITHPRKNDSKDMMSLYNKADLIDKAESFLEEVKNCSSLVYIY